MDKDYFMNAGIPPPQPLHFETSMPIPWSSDQSFSNPSSTMDQFSHFDSNWSSMVSSTTTAALSNKAFALRELIGKLGGTAAASPFASNANSTNDRSSSSPKLNMPILDQINLPNLASSAPLAPPPLPALSTDPGFAERAAKFSCFGSRSFNGRTSQFGANNAESRRGSNAPLTAEAKLPRVSSTPSLKQNGSPLQGKNSSQQQQQMEMRPVNGVVLGSDKKFSKLSGSGANSNEESSVSEQIPSGETGSMNSRKRKAISRGKTKDDRSNSPKVTSVFRYPLCLVYALLMMKFIHVTVSRELKGMTMGTRSDRGQQKMAKMRQKLMKNARQGAMTKATKIRRIKSLRNRPRTTFMSEQEGAKPQTAIV